MRFLASSHELPLSHPQLAGHVVWCEKLLLAVSLLIVIRLCVVQPQQDQNKELGVMAPVIEIFPVPPLQCNCSIIGDSESKDALVIDPGGDVDHIVSRLKFHGLSCKRILITHGHLDHIIGATELKKLTGAETRGGM